MLKLDKSQSSVLPYFVVIGAVVVVVIIMIIIIWNIVIIPVCVIIFLDTKIYENDIIKSPPRFN